MNGVGLKASITLFGFKDGFSFWFRWSIIDPVKEWWWLNITHKPYCLEHGFFEKCPESCIAEKLYKKEDISKHWKCLQQQAIKDGFL